MGTPEDEWGDDEYMGLPPDQFADADGTDAVAKPCAGLPAGYYDEDDAWEEYRTRRGGDGVKSSANPHPAGYHNDRVGEDDREEQGERGWESSANAPPAARYHAKEEVRVGNRTVQGRGGSRGKENGWKSPANPPPAGYNDDKGVDGKRGRRREGESSANALPAGYYDEDLGEEETRGWRIGDDVVDDFLVADDPSRWDEENWMLS